jgi:hypothetical protein
MDGLDWRSMGRLRIWHTRLFASFGHLSTFSTSFISAYDFMALQDGRGSNPSLAFMAERAPFYYPGPLWIYMRILVSLGGCGCLPTWGEISSTSACLDTVLERKPIWLIELFNELPLQRYYSSFDYRKWPPHRNTM